MGRGDRKMRPIRLHNMDIITGSAVVRWCEDLKSWVHCGERIIKRAKAQRLAARLDYLIKNAK